MFVKFAVWIMVFSNYPPPANHIYVGDTNSCKHSQRLVDQWTSKHFKPDGYYGWVCLRWEEHLNLLYAGRRYEDRVNNDKIQSD